MATEPGNPVEDENYDLVALLQPSLQNAWMLQQYTEDVERDDDRAPTTGGDPAQRVLSWWCTRARPPRRRRSGPGEQHPPLW